MKLTFYPKLAWDGIRKNSRLYVPYILTCGGTVMMFYIIHYLAAMPSLNGMAGGRTVGQMLGFGVWVVAVFSLVFLLYTNSFLMRRRQKEFGLYNILGMGKKHLSLVFFWETAMVYGIATVIGLIGGIALSKLMELGLIRVLSGTATYDFTINHEALADTLLIFGMIFCLLLAKGLLYLWRMNTMALLRSESAGEKPPKANYLLGIGGLILLGAAYYIAVSIRSPLAALGWFFVAVIMVIVATYMLFISGSVMLCRLLQKNKRYYYQKNHFVSTASMAYRMKRNGAGLASICILSTMVLVMLLGSGSLYFGAEDSLRVRYPKDISAAVDFNNYKPGCEYTPEKAEQLKAEINHILEENGVQPRNMECYVSTSITGLLDEGKLIFDHNVVDSTDLNTVNNVTQIYFVPLQEYNNCMGARETLEENEVLIYCFRRSYEDPTIRLVDGTVLTVKKHLDTMMTNGNAVSDIIPSVFIVVNDLEPIFASISSEFSDFAYEYFCRPTLRWSFDTDLSAEEEIRLTDAIRIWLRDLDISGEGGFYSYMTECREENRAEFYGSYGGIFFLGIILSVVFLLATVLIIYYKQITEGYEDESRYAVMRKVGMTGKDIRKSVNSQVLTVFFLPLVTAVVHLGFAFPMVHKLLILFNLRNVPLMLLVMAAVALVFGVFYALIYKLTSNAYYSIVSGPKEA